MKSLGDPFSPNSDLSHGSGCSCTDCTTKRVDGLKQSVRNPADFHPAAHADGKPTEAAAPQNRDEMIDRAVDGAIVRALFGQKEVSRRRFMSAIGKGTAAAAIASMFPLDALKTALAEDLGEPEVSTFDIGFIPITCATPIIMAEPMGFYERYGLDVSVEQTAGWAVIRDRVLAGEFNVAHMLAPMPLAMSMGVGSDRLAVQMPAVENINGQAITLRNDHKDKMDPKDWKGFTFAVPFEYSMHNFLLRYYVAEHGLDPDRDISIRVLPPPEMVANLAAGNVDGYLAPDPFNQRAVWEEVGFLHTLTKDIWEGHPCCAFAVRDDWVEAHPNTFGRLFRAIVDATDYSSKAENRSEIAEAISPRQYLNQPTPVLEQVLTGRYADGLGEIKDVPDRIDFDPFPWNSMAVWILSQMKRWGYVDGDVDYKGIAEQVYRATDCREVMEELGYDAPADNYTTHKIMGKTFDPDDPEGYIDSFDIRRS